MKDSKLTDERILELAEPWGLQTIPNTVLPFARNLEAAVLSRIPDGHGAKLEGLAQQWDGCIYEGVGEDIDIGASIRRDFKYSDDVHSVDAPAEPLPLGLETPLVTMTISISRDGSVQSDVQAHDNSYGEVLTGFAVMKHEIARIFIEREKLMHTAAPQALPAAAAENSAQQNDPESAAIREAQQSTQAAPKEQT